MSEIRNLPPVSMRTEVHRKILTEVSFDVGPRVKARTTDAKTWEKTTVRPNFYGPSCLSQPSGDLGLINEAFGGDDRRIRGGMRGGFG